MNIIKIRNLLILSLTLLVLLFVGYKYFEWKTFSDLQNTYNTGYFDEIKSVSQMESPTADYVDALLNNQQFKKPKDSADYLEGLTTIEDKLNIVINDEEGYGDLLKQKLPLFTALRNSANLLFGQRGDIAKKIVNDQIAYYQDEVNQNNITLSELYGVKILFTIYRDNTALNDFSKAVGTSTNASYISQYFNEITPLGKYADNNFKFDKEDFIKAYFPNLINKVNNWKSYFSAYYAAEKDFSVGNTDTAQLELQAVMDNGSNSYIDYSSVFNEQNSTLSDISKDVLIKVSDQAAAIKDYKSNGLYKYPFLKSLNSWKEDFVLCQMYDFKTGIYYSITSKYPVSKTVSDLINELSTISPKTDNVDGRFDKSTMIFSNIDKQLNFTCKDKYTGEKLKFFITKRS